MMHNMPRSFQFRNRWRLCLLALTLMVPFFVAVPRADAQKRRPAQSKNAQTTPGIQGLQLKNLTRLNSSETTEGSSITIFSDLPLNDYSAYRGGDRFYVLVPGADASRLVAGLRGRGFTDVRTQKRGNDVLLSFRLLAGATARVSQKFNRLEILISVPALVAANNSANTNNSNTRNSNTRSSNTGSSNTGSQTDNTRGSGNTSSGNTGTRSQTGTGNSTRGSSGTNPYGSSTTGTTSPGQNQAGTNPNYSNPPEGIPVGPDGRVEQPGVNEYPPYVQASPIASPSVAPSVDQIAQVEPTPGVPGTSIEAPPATTTTAPTSGSSFGAQLKQNWLFILLAIAVAGLIAWVIFARARGDQSLVESRLETIREPRAEPKAVAAPVKVEPAHAIEDAPVEVESKSTIAEDLIAPAVVAAVVADETTDHSVQEVVEEKEIEPQKPVAVEQASADVASLLAGNSYDETSISTEHPEARQMVAAELLAALSGRNIVRHARAREAFIKHGYFDDATRTLRTAESPGERASAARSLGLVRDESGTPHLVAALEDSSPEVRRAAVESLAEVRDPAAVAPLEALRDREKNRKVPTALIQHAIEASVIGRTKVEPPSPVAPSYATTPLTADAESYPPVVEPSIETAPLLTDELATQTPETVEPLSPAELDHQVVLEAPDTATEATPAHFAEAEIVAGETEALPYGDVQIVAPDEVEVPASTEESVPGLADSTAGEWVDFDVSRPSRLSSTVPPPSAPAGMIEEVSLEDASTGAVVADASDEVAKPIEETVHAAAEPPLLPFVATEAVIAGAISTTDERGLDVAGATEKEIDIVGGDHAGVSADMLHRLASEDDSERAAAVEELGRVGGEDSFREVSSSFDDPSTDVRNAAARALFSLNPDRAASFTRALREASPERRRNIGAALSSSGLATEAIGHLMGESREKTYDAFSLLFLMAKAGEVHPLMRAVEEHPNNEVRLAVVKLLALSGQQEILPAFRRLAVRGSLPTEVRSAVMEAIYQISSQSPGTSS